MNIHNLIHVTQHTSTQAYFQVNPDTALLIKVSFQTHSNQNLQHKLFVFQSKQDMAASSKNNYRCIPLCICLNKYYILFSDCYVECHWSTCT